MVTKSIAAMPAMWRIGLEVNLVERFEQEKHYQIMMYFAVQMLHNNVINSKDYHEIETLLHNKYSPIFFSSESKPLDK